MLSFARPAHGEMTLSANLIEVRDVPEYIEGSEQERHVDRMNGPEAGAAAGAAVPTGCPRRQLDVGGSCALGSR